MIPGGYILLARKTLESELFDKPPLWSKLWNWMLLRAEWREDAKLQRGQFWTNLEAMREAMSWHVGYRKMTPTVKETRSAYEGLRDGEMIGVAKGVQGVLITILNYDKYQSAENYERRDEGRDEGTTKGDARARYSKEVQEEKNKKKDNTPLTPHGGESAEKSKRERKTPSGNSLPFAEEFATFWESYPRRVAKPNAEKAWAKLVKAGQLPDMDTLLDAVANQAEANDWAREDGRFCPHPATWLNGRRWEDTPGIAKAAPSADLRKYRSWAESYATKRAALIGGTAETTSDVLDSGAKVLAEYITPDGFSEDEAGRIISWILAKPERAAHVSALANLADEVPGWGMLITWASNGSRGMDVGDDPRTWRKAANG